MAAFKVSHFWEATDQPIGWSEVWYVAAADLVEAQAKSLAIATERVKIASAGFTLQWSRASGNAQPGTPGTRRQRFASLARFGLTGSYLPSTTDADTAWQAVQVRFTDNTQQIFRVMMLRGIADTFWSNGDDKIARSAVNAWLIGFVPILVANSAEILHIVRGNPVRSEIPIAKGFFERLAKRDSGRPSFLFRGRRAKR